MQYIFDSLDIVYLRPTSLLYNVNKYNFAIPYESDAKHEEQTAHVLAEGMVCTTVSVETIGQSNIAWFVNTGRTLVQARTAA
jgi:hypothetical protein